MKNACFAATIALLSGCSLINSLDAVKPENDGQDAGGGHGGKGGKGTGGRASDGGSGAAGMETGGEAGSSGAGGASGGGGGGIDAGTDGSTSLDSGAGGMTGGGPEAGTGGEDGSVPFKPGGPNGAIVAYDAKEAKTFVLDPTDGHPLSSGASPVLLAIVNDPATDYWYVFRQVAAAGGPTELQVKQLNTTSGQFRDVGKAIQVPTPISPTSVGVLNQRLAYLSYPTSTDPTATTLTVLDTSTVTSIFIRASSKALPAGGKVAIDTRANATDVGGSVSILITTPQTGAACVGVGGVCNVDVSVLGETITSNTIKEDTSATPIGSISATGGSMGFASTETTDPSAARDLVVIPPIILPGASPTMCEPTSLSTGSAFLLDPSHGRSGPASAFDIDNLRVNNAAFDPCHSIAFATSLLGDTAVWAIPMSPGATTPTPAKLCTTGGAALYYERYTQGLVRLIQKGGVPTFEIYDVDASDISAPKLKPRTMHLPSPFQTAVIGVRRTNVCK